jgi:hypothetical protein
MQVTNEIVCYIANCIRMTDNKVYTKTKKILEMFTYSCNIDTNYLCKPTRKYMCFSLLYYYVLISIYFYYEQRRVISIHTLSTQTWIAGIHKQSGVYRR